MSSIIVMLKSFELVVIVCSFFLLCVHLRHPLSICSQIRPFGKHFMLMVNFSHRLHQNRIFQKRYPLFLVNSLLNVLSMFGSMIQAITVPCSAAENSISGYHVVDWLYWKRMPKQKCRQSCISMLQLDAFESQWFMRCSIKCHF